MLAFALLILLVPILLVVFILNTALNAYLRAHPPAAIADHIHTLASKRNRLIWVDEYGQVVLTRWHKERSRFIREILAPQLTELQRRATYQPIFEAEIERQIAKLDDPSSNFDKSMPPVDYEHYCAAVLQREGWNATVTRYSGDQGADVVAIKGGTRVILQCKLLTGLVGNKAVQEASAARLHYRASYAAVVSNSPYTSSARRLAATNSVFLLHHDDLPQWVGEMPTRSAISC